ncbi:MAG: 4-hydroxy-tetrahydrodipicolinate reductase [Chitinophagia bacterium]|nr:4-hydroxy-tetrahydrodipicolinate reductase [Chitinophagia bacterium]
MNIALIGYGKMGKAIEMAGLAKGYAFPLIIDLHNSASCTPEHLKSVDVAIEFTGPHTAVNNIKTCLSAGIPIVSGSTGWLDQWQEVADFCNQHKGCLVYSSNYSIGVNLFFELNEWLAKLMGNHTEYRVAMEEIHHTEKKDAPSGTAITLAEGILRQRNDLKGWVNKASSDALELPIISTRRDPAPGTHIIRYSSAIDDIEISHTAHNRIGFANGALAAAAFAINKTGIFNMKDVLGF